MQVIILFFGCTSSPTTETTYIEKSSRKYIENPLLDVINLIVNRRDTFKEDSSLFPFYFRISSEVFIRLDNSHNRNGVVLSDVEGNETNVFALVTSEFNQTYRLYDNDNFDQNKLYRIYFIRAC